MVNIGYKVTAVTVSHNNSGSFGPFENTGSFGSYDGGLFNSYGDGGSFGLYGNGSLFGPYSYDTNPFDNGDLFGTSGDGKIADESNIKSELEKIKRSRYMTGKTSRSSYYEKYGPTGSFTKTAVNTKKITSFFKWSIESVT
ncbi:13230_t:CDS:2, partial [Funneliformis geosporum]